MTRAWLLGLACVASACGRVDFDPSGQLGFVKTAVSAVDEASGTDEHFSIQAARAGDAVVLAVVCDATIAATTVALTAPGWSFAPLGPVATAPSGTLVKAVAVFGAIAPNSDPATAAVTWSSSCADRDEVGDELENNDPRGGTTTFDGYAEIHDTGNCTLAVTTGHANDLVWALCSSHGTISAAAPGTTLATNDGADDWSGYALPADPANTPETLGFTNTSTYVMVAVSIKPR